MVFKVAMELLSQSLPANPRDLIPNSIFIPAADQEVGSGPLMPSMRWKIEIADFAFRKMST
jgi:hypothetical protein